MLSKIAIKRPITTIMVVLMIVLAGVLAYTSLDLAFMPAIDLPVAMVRCTYTGAGPEEMEELVTKPIEEALATLTGVDKITSISSTGSTTVTIQFVDGTDLDMVSMDMREKLDLIARRLPSDADEPTIFKMDLNAESIDIGVTSSKYDLESLYALLDNNVTSQFEKIDGVSSVDISGEIEKEIEIIVNPDKLQGYGISVAQITGVLARENVNSPAGSIKQGVSSMQIRAVGEFSTIEEIKNLPITTNKGSVIYLKDVATVREGQKDRTSYALINGKEGILYSINKRSDANIVTTTNKIKEIVEKVGKQYTDLELEILSTTSDYIENSISNITSTAFESALIAVLVLFIILRDVNSSIVIGMSIPISIVFTFALMYITGMTLNTISMGGIVIGIGMLVDNSVVVLENIFKYAQNGYEPKEAAEQGTKEVAMAVLASTLTTVAVFLPLSFMAGMMGKMMQDLAYTIVFALAASYIVAITFVPMACSILLSKTANPDKKRNGIMRVLDKWGGALDALDRGYKRLLGIALRHKRLTILVVIVTFIGSLMIVPKVGLDLMATTDEGTLSISITLPDGTIIDETKETLSRVLNAIDGIAETETTYAQVSTANKATVSINLVDKGDRDRSTDEVCKEIEQRIANIAGAEFKVDASANAMGSMAAGENVSITLKGDETETLREISEEIIEQINQIQGARDIESSLENSLVEASVTIDRAKASKYGITTQDIASTVYSAVSGVKATEYKQDGTEIDVTIKYDEDRISYVNDLSNITIATATGSIIPITEVANIKLGESAVAINRENQQKYISITGNIDNVDAGTVQKSLKEILDNYMLPEGYSYAFSGTMELMNETFSTLINTIVVAILLVYMIMASQFESLIHPFIVMFSMPIAITGGILGLFITGQSITATVLMGFLMLVGMVVNNAIVLVDYANQLVRDNGMECNEALMEAGQSRLRPILMTTLTTIIGLVPMALGTTEGMEVQQPLGITVIFGLSLSTLLTLFLIPVLYSYVDKAKSKFANRKRRKAVVMND